MQPAKAARLAKRALARLARPRPAAPARRDSFDAQSLFPRSAGLGFYNIGADRVRAMARAIVTDNQDAWTVDDACAFADLLITDRHLEVKGIGIEVLGRYRRHFTPALLPRWKRWLANDHSANWATTDAICGLLIGPLVAAHPEPRWRGRRMGRPSQHVGPARVDRRPDPDRAARHRARHRCIGQRERCIATTRT